MVEKLPTSEKAYEWSTKILLGAAVCLIVWLVLALILFAIPPKWFIYGVVAFLKGAAKFLIIPLAVIGGILWVAAHFIAHNEKARKKSGRDQATKL